MTTTGGRGDVDLNAPDLGTLEGDDIEVFPEAPSSPSRGRMRAFLVGAIVVVLAAAAITIALINRDNTGSARVSSIAKRRVPHHAAERQARAHQAPREDSGEDPRQAARERSGSERRADGPERRDSDDRGYARRDADRSDDAAHSPSYPPSVLTWQTTPSALTIKAGGHAVVSVTVTNPTDGNVTLGQPLSCPPVLRPEHGGAAIGGGVCAQMAQVMSPHQTLTQQYRIYATSTGDASGPPLATGRYTARFENLHSIWVTVTAS